MPACRAIPAGVRSPRMFAAGQSKAVGALILFLPTGGCLLAYDGQLPHSLGQ